MKNFKKIIKFLILLKKLNIIYTIFLNFKFLPFKQAVYLPLFVYGGIKLYALSGKIVLRSETIKLGMIHIGKDLDHNPVSVLPIKLVIYDELIFTGPALISGGSTITVWRGKIIFGKNVLIGSGCQIKAVEHVSIGDNSIITSLCTVMDTNVHYVKNTDSDNIYKNSSPIHIGKNCWVNSNTVISKGAYLSDNCIVGRNSIYNLSSKICVKNSFYAGIPAKLIKSNIFPIFDFFYERELNKFFRENDINYVKSNVNTGKTMQGVLDLF